MNWDQVEGKWKQMKGSVKEKWGKFTDDDLDVINGKRESLVGKLQERYGLAGRPAFERSCQSSHTCEDGTTRQKMQSFEKFISKTPIALMQNAPTATKCIAKYEHQSI